MKKRSERESGRVGILRGFPDSPHSEEFEVADRQSLGLEQQVAQVLVADPERHGDRRGGDLGPPSRPCVSSSNWRENDWGPAVLSDYRYSVTSCRFRSPAYRPAPQQTTAFAAARFGGDLPEGRLGGVSECATTPELRAFGLREAVTGFGMCGARNWIDSTV